MWVWRSAAGVAICLLVLLAYFFVGQPYWLTGQMGVSRSSWQNIHKKGVSLPVDSLLLEGRFFHDDQNRTLQFEWPASAIRTRFRGSSIAMQLKILHGSFDSYAVSLNGSFSKMVKVPVSAEGPSNVTLAEDLDPNAEHEIAVMKVTEPKSSTACLTGFDIGEDGTWLQPPQPQERRLEFIGDSITCGYGVECANGDETDPHLQKENAYHSFATMAARKVSAEARIVAWSGKGLLQNADGTRNTTMPKLMDCILPRSQPELKGGDGDWRAHAVVVNLMTNDLAAKHQDTKEAKRDAFKDLLLRIQKQHDNPLILLSLGPMINDEWPTDRLWDLYNLRKLMQGVVASFPASARVHFVEFPNQRKERPDLALGCSEHPGIEMHKIMAQIVADTLQQQLDW